MNQDKEVCVVELDSVTTEFAEERRKKRDVDKFVYGASVMRVTRSQSRACSQLSSGQGSGCPGRLLHLRTDTENRG
jgi:hypothetical protein